MNWFLLALVGPALWAAVNHIDKYLVSKYFKGGGTGALIIFSSLIGLFVLPVILVIHPNVLAISPVQAALQTAGGILYVLSILIYFHAIQRDEASIVVPLFQTIPVFSFLLGFVLLHESLTVTQLIGSGIVVAGGIFLTLDFSLKEPKFKSAIFFLMLTASFMMALSFLVFKAVAIETDYWTTAFWGYVGSVLVGLVFLICVGSYRRQFLSVLKENNARILSLNATNEVLTVIGNLLFQYASLLAPLALVWAVNGFQPVFVLVYGLLITRFFPQVGEENLERKQLMQKAVAILIIFAGTYLLHN